MFTSTFKFHKLLLEKMKLSGKNKSQVLALSVLYQWRWFPFCSLEMEQKTVKGSWEMRMFPKYSITHDCLVDQMRYMVKKFFFNYKVWFKYKSILVILNNLLRYSSILISVLPPSFSFLPSSVSAIQIPILPMCLLAEISVAIAAYLSG